MRPLILAIVFVVTIYWVWQLIPADVRSEGLRKFRPHAIRLAALIFVVIVLAYAAYFLSSSSLLP